MRNEDIAATFNAAAESYGSGAADLINLGASTLVERLDLQASDTFVDLGCGPGALIAHAAPLLTQGEAIGVDLSRVQLELARDRFRRSKLGPRFLQQDASATELRSQTADAVGLGFAVQYAERPERLLKEATRLARLGGRVAATVLGHPFFGPPGLRLLSQLERRGVAGPELEPTIDPRHFVQQALLCEVEERRLDDVTIEEIEREFWWDSFDDWWNMLRSWGFLPTGREHMLSVIARDMRDDDRVVDSDGRVRCPVRIWLLTAAVSEGDPWL